MFDFFENLEGLAARTSQLDEYIEYLNDNNLTLETDSSDNRIKYDLLDMTTAETAYIKERLK